MTPIQTGDRLLTDLDHARLRHLHRAQASDTLADLLAAPDLVAPAAVPPDVVTMYSQVEVVNLSSGLRQRLTLCYPEDAEPSAGFISVLSPVGAGLLGLRAGATARWRTPLGDDCAARIEAVLFQPEASGDYTL